MAKCVRCGKSFFGRIKIKLADAEICGKCYDELGFNHKTGIYTGSLYKWNDIKDGYDAMRAKENTKRLAAEAAEAGLNLKLYKQLNAAGATLPETRILSTICAVLLDEKRDVDVVDVALGDNGSLLLMIDGVVFIEYKSDSGVKWIRFENEGEEKVRITGPARINAMASRIVAAFDSAVAEL